MTKDKIVYVCDNCGQESTKWIGKCPQCGEWNTFKELRIAADKPAASFASAIGSHKKDMQKALTLNEISSQDEPRIDMGDQELNRVLGGGLVKGSITLLGGEPGIGKSTLTLQTVLTLNKKVLYRLDVA